MNWIFELNWRKVKVYIFFTCYEWIFWLCKINNFPSEEGKENTLMWPLLLLQVLHHVLLQIVRVYFSGCFKYVHILQAQGTCSYSKNIHLSMIKCCINVTIIPQIWDSDFNLRLDLVWVLKLFEELTNFSDNHLGSVISQSLDTNSSSIV